VLLILKEFDMEHYLLEIYHHLVCFARLENLQWHTVYPYLGEEGEGCLELEKISSPLLAARSAPVHAAGGGECDGC
jgi:hypothetical protein